MKQCSQSRAHVNRYHLIPVPIFEHRNGLTWRETTTLCETFNRLSMILQHLFFM